MWKTILQTLTAKCKNYKVKSKQREAQTTTVVVVVVVAGKVLNKINCTKFN